MIGSDKAAKVYTKESEEVSLIFSISIRLVTQN
jgi:hypothetical protein